jgi:hypothetical protein
MASYKQIIFATGKLIAESSLVDLLSPLWKSVEWVAHPESSANTPAALALTGDTTIHLYPKLQESEEAGKLVLREFGKLILLRAGDNGKAIWEKKLDVPLDEQIKTVASKLSDTALRQRCKRYADVLNTYPTKGGSVNRLVFIHVVNALLFNNVSYADSVGVNIMTWGPTTEYCLGKKYHSLIPVVSAYSPPEVFHDFGTALAAFVIDNLAHVRDRSVAFALRGIVQRIAKLASG